MVPDVDATARESVDRVVRDFHVLYCAEYQRTWLNTYWLGVPAFKCPLDLWIYQELLWTTKPDLVIETGTKYGGTALYLASICDLIGTGRVMTIDIARLEARRKHPRVNYLTGSSVAPEIVAEVSNAVQAGERVMVILDSLHKKDHVLEELRLYAPLVTTGNYLVVEDTNVNGNPIRKDFGPGPTEAIEEFLRETDDFEIDPSCEKFFMTFNPGGYLKRVN